MQMNHAGGIGAFLDLLMFLSLCGLILTGLPVVFILTGCAIVFGGLGVMLGVFDPFVGAEAVLPMIGQRPDKAVYILARTSNASALHFQGELRQEQGLSAEVLRQSQGWVTAGHKGYVVGATYPEELAIARRLAPGANFLIPGIGAQGGDLATAVQHGPDAVAGPLISASRSILYASGGEDFAEAARQAASKLRDEINALRQLPAAY